MIEGHGRDRLLVPLQSVYKENAVFEKWDIDIFGPFAKKTRSCKQYLLTIMDHGSRMCSAILLTNVTASGIVKALIQVMCQWSIPNFICPVQGSSITVKFAQKVFELAKIEQ